MTCIHNNAGHGSGVPHDTSSEEEVTPVHTNTLKTGLQVGLQNVAIELVYPVMGLLAAYLSAEVLGVEVGSWCVLGRD